MTNCTNNWPCRKNSCSPLKQNSTQSQEKTNTKIKAIVSDNHPHLRNLRKSQIPNAGEGDVHRKPLENHQPRKIESPENGDQTLSYERG